MKFPKMAGYHLMNLSRGRRGGTLWCSPLF